MRLHGLGDSTRLCTAAEISDQPMQRVGSLSLRRWQEKTRAIADSELCKILVSPERLDRYGTDRRFAILKVSERATCPFDQPSPGRRVAAARGRERPREADKRTRVRDAIATLERMIRSLARVLDARRKLRQSLELELHSSAINDCRDHAKALRAASAIAIASTIPTAHRRAHFDRRYERTSANRAAHHDRHNAAMKMTIAATATHAGAVPPSHAMISIAIGAVKPSRTPDALSALYAKAIAPGS
jgi:hypothetical protein